jgi:hypothetical protein
MHNAEKASLLIKCMHTHIDFKFKSFLVINMHYAQVY